MREFFSFPDIPDSMPPKPEPLQYGLTEPDLQTEYLQAYISGFKAAGLFMTTGLTTQILELQGERTEWKELIKRLENETQIDHLTGLPNRRSIDNSISTLTNWAIRTKTPLCVFMVDFDRFKSINDQLGHGEGDKALVGLSLALKRRLRAMDVMGRYGGDEFVIAAPLTQTEESKDKDADARAQALMKDLQEGATTYFAREPQYNLPGAGISVGYKILDPENPCDPQDLLREADLMMYEQKVTQRRKPLEN